MKSSSKLPKCPKGWRKLKVGDIKRRTDKFWDFTSKKFRVYGTHAQELVNDEVDAGFCGFAIRRKSVRPTTKQGGGK